MELIFATGNENKVKEIRQILPSQITVRSLAEIGCFDDIPETRGTIEGNSQQKADYLHEVLRSDGFAEDTGLEVDALGGEPGVNSARYAGPAKDSDQNMDLLLRRMTGVEDRRAQFKTVITLILDGISYQFEGILSGTIGFSKVGDGGFGYDPVFVLDDGRSLAELSAVEKSRISHRAKATAKLVGFLQKRYI